MLIDFVILNFAQEIVTLCNKNVFYQWYCIWL